MFPPSCNKNTCNNLYIITTPHPSTSLHLILFYSHSILSIAQLYIQFILFFYFCVFIFTYVYFYSHLTFIVCCCCLCALEACDTKTNSLYAQAFLAIKLFPTSDYYYVYMSYLSFWNKPYLWKYVMHVFIFSILQK